MKDVRGVVSSCSIPILEALYLRIYNHRHPHVSLSRRSPWMRYPEDARMHNLFDIHV